MVLPVLRTDELGWHAGWPPDRGGRSAVPRGESGVFPPDVGRKFSAPSRHGQKWLVDSAPYHGDWVNSAGDLVGIEGQ